MNLQGINFIFHFPADLRTDALRNVENGKQEKTNRHILCFNKVKSQDNMYFIYKDAQKICSGYMYQKLEMFPSSRKQNGPKHERFQKVLAKFGM